VNRRIAGRVKHAQKRAKVRADIRAGRRISMQAFVNGSAAEHTHTHEVVEETAVLVQEPAILTATSDATHVLVRRDVSLVDGKEVESEVVRGTEYQMRKERNIRMTAQGNESTYVVRKLK
jgi:hypothetical protein